MTLFKEQDIPALLARCLRVVALAAGQCCRESLPAVLAAPSSSLFLLSFIVFSF